MPLVQEINKITPTDDLEAGHKKFALDWIESGAGLYRIKKPATPNPHLVSYFAPIDTANRKILLVHHRKANLWLPPGGHVEPDEHPREAAAREMEEELSAPAIFLQESPIFLTVTQTANDPNPHTDVSLWYLVEGSSEREYNYDEGEFHQIGWFSLDNPPTEKSEPHLTRFLDKCSQLL